MPPQLWFIVGFLVLVGVVLLGRLFLQRRRRDALVTVAGELGLEYAPEGEALLTGGLGQLELFKRGRRRGAANVMSGKIEDLELRIFDFRYTTGSGKNSSTYRQTVAAFGHPSRTLPAFTLEPEGFFHRVASAFGFQDIDFESHPRFSKQYLLRGEDEAAIRVVFTDEILEFFEGQRRLSVGAGAEWLIVYRRGASVAPSEIGAFLDTAFSVCNRLV